MKIKTVYAVIINCNDDVETILFTKVSDARKYARMREEEIEEQLGCIPDEFSYDIEKLLLNHKF